MYSVEYVSKKDVHNCWNQFALTDRKWIMQFYKAEAYLRFGRKNRVRVRSI